MQQVENLVCGGSCGDRKIVCETLVTGDHDSQLKPSFPADPDTPAESFRIPREQEQDWVNNNAFLYRKPSTKQQQPPLHSHSQRMSLNKTKSTIFGLPDIQNSRLWCSKSRPTRIHFFPRRNLARNHSSSSDQLPEIEPVSPKVSCMGRVKLKDKTKKKKKKKKRADESPTVAGKSGFWVKFTGFLRLGCREKSTEDCIERMQDRSPAKDVTVEVGRILVEESVAPATSPAEDVQVDAGVILVEESVAPPSLGAIKRFTSGRKAESMGSALDFMDFESATVGEEETSVKYEMDLHRVAMAMAPGMGKIPVKELAAVDGSGRRRRRTAARPRSVDCVRDWVTVGPVSV